MSTHFSLKTVLIRYDAKKNHIFSDIGLQNTIPLSFQYPAHYPTTIKKRLVKAA